MNPLSMRLRDIIRDFSIQTYELFHLYTDDASRFLHTHTHKCQLMLWSVVLFLNLVFMNFPFRTGNILMNVPPPIGMLVVK